jgi:chromate transporter
LFQRVRYFIFLKDVLLLALTTFGGPQAHIAHFLKVLVVKRRYLSEEDLMELNSLCQILPGPTSTQTLTAIGFKIGGPSLAYLTLLVWITPAVAIMATAAILISNFDAKTLEFTRFIEPMAVGLVSYSAYTISLKTVRTKSGIAIMIAAGVFSYFFQTPFVFPIILISAGLLTALKYKQQPREEKENINIEWSNFLLWGGVLITAAILGAVTKALPIRLFENFYRNGSLIFGGGQVLAPLLYTEFVQYKTNLYAQPITDQVFLSGYAVAQAIPGPIFSFSSFIGALAMRGGEYGTAGQVAGALMSAFGIFLPGTFLIFFVIRFWQSFKKYRGARASLEGITAASAGLVAAAAIIMFQPPENTFLNFAITIATFCLLAFTKIPSSLIILGGLLLGLIL